MEPLSKQKDSQKAWINSKVPKNGLTSTDDREATSTLPNEISTQEMDNGKQSVINRIAELKSQPNPII